MGFLPLQNRTYDRDNLPTSSSSHSSNAFQVLHQSIKNSNSTFPNSLSSINEEESYENNHEKNHQNNNDDHDNDNDNIFVHNPNLNELASKVAQTDNCTFAKTVCLELIKQFSTGLDKGCNIMKEFYLNKLRQQQENHENELRQQREHLHELSSQIL